MEPASLAVTLVERQGHLPGSRAPREYYGVIPGSFILILANFRGQIFPGPSATLISESEDSLLANQGQ
eukprot:757754-Hanusia_phi.AAC.3